MIRTRFAPSPTGYLHIGGVRTALFNWLFARQHGGHFVLRIDDTDQQRNVEESLQPILDGFRWLGLDWDEGPEVGGSHAPYFQSQRADRYQAAVQQLLEAGAAYHDYARTEEIQAERAAAEKSKQAFRYSRRWAAESTEDHERFQAEGRESVVRLKMPASGECVFDDLIRGRVSFAWNQEQDHVIQRADGTCLYHLANVVDDHDLEITHVIRAVEHLSNTPRQVFIAQSLGYELPHYAHLPYVAEPGSSNKLSKRKLDKYLKNQDFKKVFEHGESIARRLGEEVSKDTFNPVIVDFYRRVGYLPEAILNYLLLLGWSLDDKTESFAREEMIRLFSLQRVNKGPASFDPQKLMAVQQRYMNELPIKQKVNRVLPFLQEAGWVERPPSCDIGPQLTKLLQAAGDRLKVAGDILDYPEFFLPDDQLPYDEAAVNKRLRTSEAQVLLRQYRDRLATLEPFDAAATEAAMKELLEQQGAKIGQLIHALRVAVSGKAVGIGMFDTLELLGRERCVKRIDQALQRVDETADA